MRVSVTEFITSPAFYLEKVGEDSIIITKDGITIAVLTKPSSTPIADSLLGILRDSGISNTDDIKEMRTGV